MLEQESEPQNLIFLLFIHLFILHFLKGVNEFSAEPCNSCETRQRGGRKLQAKGLCTALGLVRYDSLGHLPVSV